MKRHLAIVGIFLIFTACGILSAQTSREESPATSLIFQEIQSGIASGNLKLFSSYLAKQIYLDLPGEETGYFSANQAFFILQNFFGARKAVQFKFSTIDESDSGPFATGSGTFISRGHRETVQIYILLSKTDDRWVITQFNVY